MKKILKIISLLLLCLSLIPPIFANDNQSIKKINLTEEANWPPFTPNKYGMTQEGLSYILMKEIFSRLNIEVSLELFPQNRMLQYLKIGRKDASTLISKSLEREEYLEFSESIVQKKGFIYYLKDNYPNFIWTNFKDLQGLSIGVVAGHNLGKEFKEAIKEHNLLIQSVSKSKQSFEMLLNRRVDIILSIEPTANHFLSKPKYANKIGRATKTYYSKYYHIGFSKKSKAKVLLPRVNEVIRQMKKDGSLKKILSPYSMSF